MTDEKPLKRKALGKGLGSLIPASKIDRRDYFMCRLDDIQPNESQPRRHFDEVALEELARSIEESGLIQPLVVRQVNGLYEIIAGERRWRASRLAGVTEVPVVVRELADSQAFLLALVENIQREDLNPVEEAMAFKRLVDEFSMTQQQVSDKVGKSRPAVANSLRLLSLPASVRTMLASGQITAGHAKILVTLPAEEAEELADIIVRHELSVREAEELARQARKAAEPVVPPNSKFRDDVHVRDIAARLQTLLGTRVKVKDRKGKGTIEIHYANYEVLQAVLEQLGAAES
jgi:ParB family chromosome partitioning protein